MTIEETKELIAENRIAVMQAYVDGKQIQFFNEYTREWEDIPTPNWLRDTFYRVKSETKCRPFKNADECWQEMLKHEPFGWVISKRRKDCFINIVQLHSISGETVANFTFTTVNGSKTLLEGYTFADGAPFGVKGE